MSGKHAIFVAKTVEVLCPDCGERLPNQFGGCTEGIYLFDLEKLRSGASREEECAKCGYSFRVATHDGVRTLSPFPVSS